MLKWGMIYNILVAVLKKAGDRNLVKESQAMIITFSHKLPYLSTKMH
jgi:hypothetical protein